MKGEFDDQSNKKICFSKNFMKIKYNINFRKRYYKHNSNICLRFEVKS
jgi:hypothetical protein